MTFKKLSTFNLLIINLGSILLFLLSYIANYGTSIVLARSLSADEFGEYNAIIYSLHLLATISLLGMDYALIKFIPTYIYKGEWANAAGYLRYSVQFLIKSSMIIFTIGIIIAGLSYYFDEIKIFPITDNHLIFFLWLIPFIAISDFLKKSLRSFQQPYLSFILTIQFFQPLTILFIYYFKKLGPIINMYSIMLIYLIITILAIIIELIVIYFKIPEKLITTMPKYQKSWRMAAISILVNTLLISNINALSVIISKTFSVDEMASGTLSAVILISGFIWMFNSAINMIIEPLVCIAAELGKKQMQSLINSSCFLIFILGGTWMLIIIFYGHSLLASFRPEFVSGYVPLLVISGVSLFASIFGTSSVLLKYVGHENKLIHSTIIGLVLFIIMGSYTVKYYGIWGSVITFTFIQIIITIYFAYLAKTSFGIRPFIIV